MFTVCPKCALTLVVTAADLRIAQGYVRCGRCSNVFNALLGLSDERKLDASSTQTRIDPTLTFGHHEQPLPLGHNDPPLPRWERQSAPQPEEVAAEPPPRELTPDASLEFNPESTDVSEVFIEPGRGGQDEVTGTFETIVLRAEELAPPEEPPSPVDAQLDRDLRSLAARVEAARDSRTPIRRTAEQASRADSPAPRSEPAPQTPSETFSDEPASGPRHTLWWSAAAAAALLVLAAQFAHHYRNDLAVNATLHGPLTRLYAAFGVTLTPHWDLGAYEVHQLGASAGSGAEGELTVRASLKNDAPQPQPMPLLRVTVQDRFGNRVAARDVAPAAYLPRSGPPAAFLPAGARIDAEMTFADPGQDAVGFEIDACLPAPGGRIACANDLAAR